MTDKPYLPRGDDTINAGPRNEAAYALLDRINRATTWGGYDDFPAFRLADGSAVTQGDLRAIFFPGNP